MGRWIRQARDPAPALAHPNWQPCTAALSVVRVIRPDTSPTELVADEKLQGTTGICKRSFSCVPYESKSGKSSPLCRGLER